MVCRRREERREKERERDGVAVVVVVAVLDLRLAARRLPRPPPRLLLAQESIPSEGIIQG